MTETTSPRVIRKALSEAIWGYVFLYFNLNIGAVDLLPEFVGWILLLSAVRGLEAGLCGRVSARLGTPAQQYVEK